MTGGPAPLPAPFPANPPTPLHEVREARFAAAGVRLVLKRDDLLHPPVSGTKWRKLLPNLDEARRRGLGTLLTFGGAYSNHLRAAAAAGREAGLRTVGVVRGDELRGRPLNPSLARAVADGMELDFLDRASWRARATSAVLGPLLERHGPAWVVPEGGSNVLGVRGCATLGRELACGGLPGTEAAGAGPAGSAGGGGLRPDVVCCSVGTGGMLAGLVSGLAPDQRAIGFAALAHAPLAAETEALRRAAFPASAGEDEDEGGADDPAGGTARWRVDLGHVRRGYGRSDAELDSFAAEFEGRHGVALDRGYEAKALLGMFAALDAGEFRAGTTVALVIAG